jgi:inorganic triphosphatase YgiF
LDATYFDTVDRLLLRRKMALRLRRTGRRWVQTLKAAGSGSGGLSVRSEWETPARFVGGVPRIDLARLADSPLPRLLQKRGGTKALLPVLGTRFSRTLWQLQFRGSLVEVALDLGRSGDTQWGACRRTDLRTRAELKQGRGSTALALRLVGRGRATLPLVPRVRSKADRGYVLASGTPAPPVKAGARGFVDVVAPEMASGSALRALVAHGMQVMLANTEAMRAHDDPEYVHQARVALRRIRSAVRLLDREHADFPATLASELQWAGELLGAAATGTCSRARRCLTSSRRRERRPQRQRSVRGRNLSGRRRATPRSQDSTPPASRA